MGYFSGNITSSTRYEGAWKARKGVGGASIPGNKQALAVVRHRRLCALWICSLRIVC